MIYLLVLASEQHFESLVFEVRPFDPVTYAGVALGLVATAVLASYLPALQATTVSPLEALRDE